MKSTTTRKTKLLRLLTDITHDGTEPVNIAFKSLLRLASWWLIKLTIKTKGDIKCKIIKRVEFFKNLDFISFCLFRYEGKTV